MAAPERTCIGCRTRRDQAELVRLKVEGGLVRLARPGSPGRSAYLCPDPRCLEAAERRRAFARAFREPATLDSAVVRALKRPAGRRDSHHVPRNGEPVAVHEERR